MFIKEISISNVRSIVQLNIEASSNINIFVGPNNSGKSTILNSMLLLQKVDDQNCMLLPKNIRLGTDRSQIKFELQSHPELSQVLAYCKKLKNSRYSVDGQKVNIRRGQSKFNGANNFSIARPIEPENVLHNYSTKRKVKNYNNEIGDLSLQVVDDLSTLPAKLDKIYDPALEIYDDYVQACEKILGFVVSPLGKGNGKTLAYKLDSKASIEIDDMGEGIGHLVGFIIDLCRVQNKIFVIEEPENDLHPKALKALSELILKSSESNQFFISTHSNILVKTLGSQPQTNLYQVSLDFVNKIPTSSINLVDEPSKRKEVLEELGYELFDYDLWDGWILFEESSAERIVRDYLFKWFTPKMLGRVRTLSSQGLGQVKSKFSSFNNLFLFLHLSELYHNKAWVIVDDGEQEKRVIEDLENSYKSWDPDNFIQFENHDFEEYYPERFYDDVQKALQTSGKEEKRSAKEKLLKKVLGWIDKNEEDARNEFEQSALEVISILKSVETKLFG